MWLMLGFLTGYLDVYVVLGVFCVITWENTEHGRLQTLFIYQPTGQFDLLLLTLEGSQSFSSNYRMVLICQALYLHGLSPS